MEQSIYSDICELEKIAQRVLKRIDDDYEVSFTKGNYWDQYSQAAAICAHVSVLKSYHLKELNKS
jgi:hypothetical protein